MFRLVKFVSPRGGQSLTLSTFRAFSSEINEYQKLHDISIRDRKGQNFPPMTSFDQTPFPPTIINSLLNEGFVEPTPIQAQSWSIALAGRDLISVARTGSGKTCGFLLPGFLKVLNNPKDFYGSRRRPQILILAPTRELSIQIFEEATKFSKSTGLLILPLYGGAPRGVQVRQLSRGVDIIVGTPGRCNDLMEAGELDLSNVHYLVLDEADRMLDMGFEPQIKTLIKECNSNRQSLFFTATWPKAIVNLAHDYLKDPVEVKLGGVDTLNANKSIQQHIHVLKNIDKFPKLEELLESFVPDDPSKTLAERKASIPKVLIFVARKLDCDDLAYELRDLGYPVGTLHGDKDQTARTIIMNKFRSGALRLLVATDVAARGLDIKDIEVVINYDFVNKEGLEDYVHRIGRTARGDRTGIAHSFLTAENANCALGLADLLRRSGQPVPQALLDLARSSSSSKSSSNRDNFDPIASRGGNKRRSNRSNDVQQSNLSRLFSDPISPLSRKDELHDLFKKPSPKFVGGRMVHDDK